jgi:hypothetical protein
MINESKKSDFFPISREQLKKLTYQGTEEDLLHEKYVRELEAEIHENSDADLENNLGELPFDEEADRKRWENLEKDFDRIFEDAKHRAD